MDRDDRWGIFGYEYDVTISYVFVLDEKRQSITNRAALMFRIVPHDPRRRR